MATVRSLVQIAGTSATHLDEIKKLLKLKDQDALLLSSAFVRSRGVIPIATLLKKRGAITQVFVGIRNGVTSVQGVMELIKAGAEVTVVDTGAASPIFHPKIYCAWDTSISHVIIGSANLTHQGLNNNIEASVLIELDLTKKNDKEYLKHLRQSFASLESIYPEHVTKVLTVRDAVKLYHEGLLEDERVYRAVKSTAATPGGKVAPKDIIPLNFKKPASSEYRSLRKQKKVVAAVGASSLTSAGSLLWVKPKLKESHIQSPSKPQTNPVGALRLGSARYKVDGEIIDQTKYFRNIVFSDLEWTSDPVINHPNKEVATAKFEIIISGVNYGVFNLNLSHEPDREAKQNNATTLIHWGTATTIIKQKNLVGRGLYLYEPLAKELPFTIEIK